MTVDRTKLYPPLEAIKLAQGTAKNKFEGKIEIHAVLGKAGKFGVYKTERKAPLFHGVLGKQSQKPEALAIELLKIAKALESAGLKKLILSATMGPGVKVDFSSFAKS